MFKTRFIARILAGVLGGALLAFLAVPQGPISARVRASNDPASEDLEQNQQLLATLRSDPERYARLMRDLRSFLALPPERQERMRELNRDMDDIESVSQAH